MSTKNTSAGVERPFNLTENEVNFTLHACKLLIQDGKVDRNSLAAATGKGNPDTARRMWSQIKNKMGVNAASLASGNGVVAMTPTKTTTKRKADTPMSNTKGDSKRVKKEAFEHGRGGADEDVEMKEEDTPDFV